MTGRPASKPKPRSRPASPQVGGKIVESIRIPLANPDFAPSLQRIADLKPDTAFIYFPGPQAPIFTKQFAGAAASANPASRSSARATLPTTTSQHHAGDQMIGLITAGPYSAAHNSALNKTYVADFEKAEQLAAGLRLARRL